MSKKLDIALSRIDSFIARCSKSIQRIEKGLELTSEYEFSEQELTNLDSLLSGLAIDLMAGEEIDDGVWQPPISESYSNWDRSSKDQTAWLKEFRRSLNSSREFFKAFTVSENASDPKGDSVNSGGHSNNFIVKEGGSVEINKNSGQPLIHQPSVEEIKAYDPKTRELLDKVESAPPQIQVAKRAVPSFYRYIASHVSGMALIVTAIVALITAADGIINNWDIARKLVDIIFGPSGICNPDIVTPQEYDKCVGN